MTKNGIREGLQITDANLNADSNDLQHPFASLSLKERRVDGETSQAFLLPDFEMMREGIPVIQPVIIDAPDFQAFRASQSLLLSSEIQEKWNQHVEEWIKKWTENIHPEPNPSDKVDYTQAAQNHIISDAKQTSNPVFYVRSHYARIPGNLVDLIQKALGEGPAP